MNLLTYIKFSTKHIKSKDVKQIAWKVSINGKTFRYSTGIGYLGGPDKTRLNDRSIWMQDAISSITLGGQDKSGGVGGSIANLKVVSPKLEDVLQCLILDSSALEQSFKEWCNELGYNPDSIKARNVWKECRKNGRKLKRALGMQYDSIKAYIEGLEL